jgi:hypothetical protein
MIDGIKFVRAVLKKDMTAFPVRVVTEQIKKDNRFEQLFIFVREAEVMIFRIVFNVLLERTGAKWSILAEGSEWNKMKAQMFAHQVRGDLTPCERIFGEIPKRLLSSQRLVHGGIFLVFVLDSHKERVIRAERELAFDLVTAVL